MDDAPATPCDACPVGDARCRGLHHKRDCENARRDVPGYAAMLRELAGSAPPSTFLLTGGLGDVLTLESWMSDDDRARCRTILWAAPGSREIAAVLATVPALAHVEHIHLWDDFSAAGRRAFYAAAEVAAAVPDPRLADSEDWSIAGKFPAIEAGRYRWGGSSLLRPPSADISGFALPARYVVVCPETTSTHRLDRFLTPAEWGWMTAYLDRTGESAVVLNGPGAAPPPAHPRLLDLSGRTTLREAAAVVRGADGYAGIDSALSVFAAEILPAHRMAVRTTVAHLHRWQAVYYPRLAGRVVVRRRLADFGAWPRDPLAAYRWTAGADERLEYCPERGVARLRGEIDPSIYSVDYFNKYKSYERTGFGRALNDFRVALARKYAGESGGVLDVGIGSGTFLRRLGPGRLRYGFDVNPAGIEWLEDRGMWHDPHRGLPECCRVVCLFDSLEHMEWPGEMLGRFPDGVHVIVSIPVFDDLGRIAESRHFRPREHRWYFRPDGLTSYLGELGYTVVESSRRETEIGRTDIATFVFRKGDGALPKPRVPLGTRAGPG